MSYGVAVLVRTASYDVLAEFGQTDSRTGSLVTADLFVPNAAGFAAGTAIAGSAPPAHDLITAASGGCI